MLSDYRNSFQNCYRQVAVVTYSACGRHFVYWYFLWSLLEGQKGICFLIDSKLAKVSFGDEFSELLLIQRSAAVLSKAWRLF